MLSAGSVPVPVLFLFVSAARVFVWGLPLWLKEVILMHRRQHGMLVRMCFGGLEDSVHWFLPSFGGMHEAGVGEAVDPSLVCASAFCFGVFLVCVVKSKRAQGCRIFSWVVSEGWGHMRRLHRAMMKG